MGKEIGNNGFTADDFVRFSQRLALETRHAQDAYARGDFANTGLVAGFELEAWLIDENLFPVPRNVSFLARMASPLVVPELSLFNVEINGTPQALRATALSQLEGELIATWQRCQQVAADEGVTALRRMTSRASASALSKRPRMPTRRTGREVSPMPAWSRVSNLRPG